jgi:hypothetical protein
LITHTRTEYSAQPLRVCVATPIDLL